MRIVGAGKSETAIEHQARDVKGAATVMVGATWKEVAAAHASVSVKGGSIEDVGAAKSITTGKYAVSVKGALNETFASRKVNAGSDHVESFGGIATYNISGAAKFKGANVVVKAKSKITVKAGGMTLEITPGTITIKGKFDGAKGSVEDGDEKYE